MVKKGNFLLWQIPFLPLKQALIHPNAMYFLPNFSDLLPINSSQFKLQLTPKHHKSMLSFFFLES
jgi:hypothetical protein